MELTPLQQYVLISQLTDDICDRKGQFIRCLYKAITKGAKIDGSIIAFIGDILSIAVEKDTQMFYKMLTCTEELKRVCTPLMAVEDNEIPFTKEVEKYLNKKLDLLEDRIIDLERGPRISLIPNGDRSILVEC